MSTKSRGYIADHVTSKPRDLARPRGQISHVRKRRRSEQDSAEWRKEKAAHISALLKRGQDISREEIRSLAMTEGGLLSNEYRKVLWLQYLGVDEKTCVTECDITEFRDYTQVCLDVHRCNSRIKTGTLSQQILAIKNRLRNVIIKSLAEAPNQHYYQGYHDVSLTMLYVLGERRAAALMSCLCRAHLASHIRENLDETSQQMKLIVPLVSQKSVELADFILQSEAGTMFSLSWIITWFAYVVNSEDTIYRLYDVFITSPPLMPVYLSAAIVLYRKHRILEVECELSSVHQVLHNLPQHLPFDLLIKNAVELLDEFPPEIIKTLPIKQHQIMLQVPRFGYLDWSRNWGGKLLEYANTPAGIAISSSFLVGFAAFALSVYSGRFQM
ncbi:TBC1 domain family member 20-like [Bolinopsis microptera]|uniref:TBC1 domain family member 20-like n=1 Tax=Bolinopsis microptera TaxID=2820187 RepID=UPI003079B594